MERLKRLLEEAEVNKGPWELRMKDGRVLPMMGTIPDHYKRLSCSDDEAMRLAKIGASQLLAAFNIQTYFTQSVIAGAMLSGDYDTVIIVTPSQYGKSWLMGHIAPLMAFKGQRLTVAAAVANTTEIIMTYIRQTLSSAMPDIKQAIVGETMKKIDRLDQSLSKSRISFAVGGYIDAITLGDTYNGISHNKAVGRGTGYIVDEAALVSSEALAEIGRREFSRTDGKKEILVMISNPHQPGAFYDELIDEDPDERKLIVWMDALTSVQESRWSVDQVLKSDAAKRTDTRTKYLMCELPQTGDGMFKVPRIADPPHDGIHFIGIDSAYKGKDDIVLTDCVLTDNKLYAYKQFTVNKGKWVTGETSERIILNCARYCMNVRAPLVCVDVGQGIWLTEGLVRYGVRALGMNFGASPTKERSDNRYERQTDYAATAAYNLRAEMHLDVQDLFETERLLVSKDVYDGIINVLPLITTEVKANGKIQIRDKKEIRAIMGKSPDRFDSLLLAVHAAILYLRSNVAFIT